MRKLIIIDGTIELSEDMTEDQFQDLFLNFMEEHNMSFMGGTEYEEVQINHE